MHVERALVPDETDKIQEAVKKWADDDKVHLILTTGGTGFSPRDITPEAVGPLLHRHAPGIVTQMCVQSLAVTPMAMLSRPVAGTRSTTLIVTLPGSSKAAVECLTFILPALPHAIDLLSSNAPEVSATHAKVQSLPSPAKQPSQQHGSGHTCLHHTDKVSDGSEPRKPKAHRHDLTDITTRPRQSEYPMLSMAESVSAVLSRSKPLSKEVIPIRKAISRVLAEDVKASSPLPPFPAAMKDGYAVVASDGPGVFEVLGPVTAGNPNTLALKPGYVIRIATGAPVPQGADAVVQIEDTDLLELTDDRREEKRIRILVKVESGQEIRPRGADIAENETILTAGTTLGPAEV